MRYREGFSPTSVDTNRSLLSIMEDIFGQIECRSRSDSIVMKILRSAMDKAHEELQPIDGPIEFLHKRSTFYVLAAILVEGSLNIVREETDVLKGSGDKILSDLTEIRHWLRGRIQDMKRLIVEKDNELIESSENESKLREAIESKERELSGEPGKNKNEDFLAKSQAIQDVSAELDIAKWKNTVDLQVSNIKQKLENEKKGLTSEMIIKKRQSRLSSPNLSFDFLEKERKEGSELADQDSSGIDRFSQTRTRTDDSTNDQNVLIGRMSSDIDILKETLDHAFGKMRSAGVVPLEKHWRCDVEKDIEMILMKGFISDLQQSCDEASNIKVGNSKDDFFEFIKEMINLFRELKDLHNVTDVLEKGSRRTTSEPLQVSSFMEDTEYEGNNYVAKMVKNHESIMRKQRSEWNWLTSKIFQGKGHALWGEKEESHDNLERRIQDAITRLENFVQRGGHKRVSVPDDGGEKHNVQEKRRIQYSDPRTITDLSTSAVHIDQTSGREAHSNEFSLVNCNYEVSIQNLLKEDVCKVFLRDLVKTLTLDKADFYTESLIREDIHQFVLIQAVRDFHVHHTLEQQLDIQERTPRSRKFNGDHLQGTTPRSRRLDADSSQECTPRSRIDIVAEGTPRSRMLSPRCKNEGDEGLIQKLDSLLRCLETEEDLMLSASSEIKERSANNNLVISSCEEVEERDAIEWLITDDESMFSSVSEKLERALQQLYASKGLLVELEEGLEASEDSGENDRYQESNDDITENIIMQFQQLLGNVEHVVNENIKNNCVRVEVLKHRLDSLTRHVVLMRTRKLLYKNAFLSRCHSLKLAETEVDLLGDQVESLLCVLEKIYIELDKNAIVLSRYIAVGDMLKLIKRELKTEQ